MKLKEGDVLSLDSMQAMPDHPPKYLYSVVVEIKESAYPMEVENEIGIVDAGYHAVFKNLDSPQRISSVFITDEARIAKYPHLEGNFTYESFMELRELVEDPDIIESVHSGCGYDPNDNLEYEIEELQQTQVIESEGQQIGISKLFHGHWWRDYSFHSWSSLEFPSLLIIEPSGYMDGGYEQECGLSKKLDHVIQQKHQHIIFSFRKWQSTRAWGVWYFLDDWRKKLERDGRTLSLCCLPPIAVRFLLNCSEDYEEKVSLITYPSLGEAVSAALVNEKN